LIRLFDQSERLNILLPMTTAPDLNHFLHDKQPLWNSLAIGYAVGGYALGIWLILDANVWLNGLGVLLLTHSLVISAYLSHEFMHGTIFDSLSANARGGNLMLFLNGGCYGRFQELMKMHIAHHVNRVDYYRFDLAAFLQALPPPLRWILLGLEWLYFPALAFLLRLRAILAPFFSPERRDERLRVVLLLSGRGLLFGLLTYLTPKALLLYFLSYIGMIHLLRFLDAFQHTYEVFPVGATLPKRDHAHEQANTFSNLLSKRHQWLNLLFLNFGYHNAHHELMKCPWYSLPELDQALYQGGEVQYVTLPQLLGNYHRFRLARIFNGQGQAVDPQGNLQLETFYGGIEVSFLVVPA
jgi:fatty acid desaturase